MSLNFRVRRRVGVPPQTRTPSDSDILHDLFRGWQAACSELRTAENASVDQDAVLDLATDVIRTRNKLTRAQIANGWSAPRDVLDDLERDELLVQEADDRRL
jgi:hypothetical protein